MAERKPIHINPASETAKLLERVGDHPITVESGGVRFCIEREESVTFETYDAAKALAGLRSGIGLFEGIDVGQVMCEIREQRSQDSSGRPA